jgi:ectoine hydroxylase-related dioxygenase (phytanoyl-CoA dioxygenase family)
MMDLAHPRARRLSSAELSEYRTNGYLVIPDVFDAADLALMSAEMDRLLPSCGDPADFREGWILGVGNKSENAAAFVEDPRVLALMEDIVQPGIATCASKLVTKMPHAEYVCHWHQDDAFFCTSPALASDVRLSTWIPLQDADETNGCLWVVPGSHKAGLQPFEDVDWGQCRRRIAAPDPATIGRGIPVPAKAGSVVFLDAKLWHHSGRNHTDWPRRALIASYQEATLPEAPPHRPAGAKPGPMWRVLRPAAG